jgi:hypothetical protein
VFQVRKLHPAKKNTGLRLNERIRKGNNRRISAVNAKKERHKVAICIVARDSDVIIGPETNKVRPGVSVRRKETGRHVQTGHAGDPERARRRRDHACGGSALYVRERRDNKIQRDLGTEGKLCAFHVEAPKVYDSSEQE